MSSKKELRKQLEAAYLKGFISGYLNDQGFLEDEYDEHYSELLIELETLYGKQLGDDEWPKKAPFEKALKEWKELRESPLCKAVE